MVLVMESDGSLTPSRSQDSFARNYNDGIGQGSAADELAFLGEDEPAIEPDALRFAALARSAPCPAPMFWRPSNPPPFATPGIPGYAARISRFVIG